MKVNRNSWHYRFRAWALREEGFETFVEPKHRNVGMGEYISDIVVFGIGSPLRWLGQCLQIIIGSPLGWLGKWLRSKMGDAEFHNEKDKQ